MKIFRFQIEVAILPRLDRLMESFLESNEIVERSTSFIVSSADRCFGQIKVAVAARVVAFAKQLLIFRIGE